MPRIITSHEKLSVIEDWLSGESRIDIAKKHNIGSGTVYNIVQEWIKGLGDAQLADRLRELGIKLRKNGLTVSDCARGLRMLMMLKKYDIQDTENQEKVPYFLKEIYASCQEVGLTAHKVFDYIGDILKFSSEIPLSQIPNFIEKKIEEKKFLGSQIQQLSRNIDELTERKDELEQEIQEFRNIQETMSKNYQTFAMIKFKLKQYGIQMEDLALFVKCVVGISKEGYNSVQVVTKIADYENLKSETDYYKSQVTIKKDELAKVNQDLDAKGKILDYFKIKVDLLDELERRGFGNNELRTLINLLNEIGLEKNQEFEELRKVFFQDLKNYDEVIGSRKEIDRLKNEQKNLEVQILKERENFNAYPQVIESVIRLAGSGISEEDIVKIDRILSMTDYYINKDNRLYKEALLDDLQKYRNLKLAIKKLEDIQTDLKSPKKILHKPRKNKPRNV
jgi:outer membrane murein-binding lipoprotein Lpp